MQKVHLRYEESRASICGAGQGQKTHQRVLAVTFADVRADPAALARVTCVRCDALAPLYARYWRK
jgi:hypothetical protein